MKVKLRLLALCVLLCCLTLVAAGQRSSPKPEPAGSSRFNHHFRGASPVQTRLERLAQRNKKGKRGVFQRAQYSHVFGDW